ncbi:dnaJ/Hsp40 cysteine-rich domain superfamily protein isoform X2 [Wolffia australiana]
MEIMIGMSTASWSAGSICRSRTLFFGDGHGILAGRLRRVSVRLPVFPRQPLRVISSASGDLQSCIGKLESLFCYDKPIPEENIEKPIGLSLSAKEIGGKAPCTDCESKGAVLCATCSGSGLYVDSILESQGVIVKVRCLGCGGSGNVMCFTCGGRGHL